MSPCHRIAPELIELSAHERSVVCARLQAHFPRLAFDRAAARLEAVLGELGVVCEAQPDGALLLSLAGAHADELRTLVQPGGWAWR